MINEHLKLKLTISLALLLMLLPGTAPARAEWPPFTLRITPSYDDGLISYSFRLAKLDHVNGPMMDVEIKFPIPDGTRFVEANALPTSAISFDGQEVTFFTATVHSSVSNASFTLEVTDPAKTVVTIQPWITWKGGMGGEYLAPNTSLDISKKPLIWDRPYTPPLLIEATATVVDETITYSIYLHHIGRRRMWDLHVTVPIPKGTEFVSAQGPATFAIIRKDQEVLFTTLEMPRETEVEPLRLTVAAKDHTELVAITRAWASWRNIGWGVGEWIPVEERASTGNIIVQPYTVQQVVSDKIGDVPFASYDLTSMALQKDGSALKVVFHTIGELGPVDNPLIYDFYMDTDCNADTGQSKNGRGAEYLARYEYSRALARLFAWESETERWRRIESLQFTSPAQHDQMVSIWIPYKLLNNNNGQFCWTGLAIYYSKEFMTNPRTEYMPRALTQYEPLALPDALVSGTGEDLDEELMLANPVSEPGTDEN